MSDQLLLCKCSSCLTENVNGVLLTRNTYNRHRLRTQKYSVGDENLEDDENLNDVRSQMEENISLDTEEGMNLEEIYLQKDYDIYQQENNLNLVNSDSDTEIIN